MRSNARRSWWLWAALLATLAAAWWPVDDEAPEVASPKARSGGAPLEPRPDRTDLGPVKPRQRGSPDRPVIDVFADAPPPVRPPVGRPAAAPPTVEPAAETSLVYGGRYAEGDSEAVLLVDGAVVHRVRIGDAVGTTGYRVEAATAASITLRHAGSGRTAVISRQ